MRALAGMKNMGKVPICKVRALLISRYRFMQDVELCSLCIKIAGELGVTHSTPLLWMRIGIQFVGRCVARKLGG